MAGRYEPNGNLVQFFDLLRRIGVHCEKDWKIALNFPLSK
jgi:hypothetical protein